MYVLKTWPISLLTFSFRTRLSLLVLVFAGCLGIFWIVFPLTHNGTCVVIPIILSAWLFRFRGMLLCIGATALALACSYSLMLGTILWPRPFVLFAVTGFFTGLLVGLIVSYLRYMVDVVEEARKVAQRAEQQWTIAFEERLEAVKEQQRLLLENQQQRQINAIKDQLLVSVNHEFRTPLTGVYGYLQLLHDTGIQDLSPGQKRYLTRAMEGCEELMDIISTMLDPTQISNELALAKHEDLALATLVQNVVALSDPHLVQAYDVHVEIAEHVHVWADGQFVRQVVRNLLSNAFKYAPKHTPILIDVVSSERTIAEKSAFPHICIRVKDAGPGIAPTDIPLLFQKFVRLKRDVAGPVRGTGLGLYVSRQLVEAMHGQIWVESSGRAGEGASFFFTLPTGNSLNAPSP